MEAQGYKSAVGVADELRTLLEGSKRAGTLKGGEELPAFTLAPQRLGAAAEAVAAAYQATRSEVQSEALPAKVRGEERLVGGMGRRLSCTGQG